MRWLACVIVIAADVLETNIDSHQAIRATTDNAYGIGNQLISVMLMYLSGMPDYFDRNKISSGGDLSHYSSASLY